MRCSDNELEMLEEEIQENIEWLSTIDNDDIECIGIENLEAILTRFFNRKISLSL
jgi:Ca2+-binding EF-hand superfamily protein